MIQRVPLGKSHGYDQAARHLGASADLTVDLAAAVDTCPVGSVSIMLTPQDRAEDTRIGLLKNLYLKKIKNQLSS